MALDWKKALVPVTKKQASAAAQMTPAERLADTMEIALGNYKRGNKTAKGEEVKRPTIRAAGDNVIFSVRYANVALKLDGTNTEFSVPAAKFEDIFKAIRESAIGGEFDGQLKDLAVRVRERGEKAAAARAKK